MSTNTTQVTAQDALAALDNFSAVMRAFLTGGEATPPVETVTVTAAATEPEAPATYQARSKTAKAKVHAEIRKINVRYDMKLAGGARKVSDLGAKERKAYDAEVAAAWKAAPRTVTVTKA